MKRAIFICNHIGLSASGQPQVVLCRERGGYQETEAGRQYAPTVKIGAWMFGGLFPNPGEAVYAEFDERALTPLPPNYRVLRNAKLSLSCPEWARTGELPITDQEIEEARQPDDDTPPHPAEAE